MLNCSQFEQVNALLLSKAVQLTVRGFGDRHKASCRHFLVVNLIVASDTSVIQLSKQFLIYLLLSSGVDQRITKS